MKRRGAVFFNTLSKEDCLNGNQKHTCGVHEKRWSFATFFEFFQLFFKSCDFLSFAQFRARGFICLYPLFSLCHACFEFRKAAAI